MNAKILIDTDPGHDDAMAIMLACLSGKFEVIAITTVAGNSTIENTTRNARFIVNFLKAEIPIYSGANKPLKRALIQATVHGHSGLEGVNPTNDSNLTGDAVDKIIDLARTHQAELTIVALGPATNIARAIQKNPLVMAGVRQIVVMGGAYKVAGNQTPSAEFNMFVDPEAAAIICQSGIPLLLVPLDACNGVCIWPANLAVIKHQALRRLMTDMVLPYMRNVKIDTGIAGAVMYDPVAIFSLMELAACQTAFVDSLVVSTNKIDRGTTAINLSPVTRPTQIVLSVPDDLFRSVFFRALNRFA